MLVSAVVSVLILFVFSSEISSQVDLILEFSAVFEGLIISLVGFESATLQAADFSITTLSSSASERIETSSSEPSEVNLSSIPRKNK